MTPSPDFPLDYQTRDRVLFGQPLDWEARSAPPGVSEPFAGLGVASLQDLIALGFADPQSAVNAAPTLGQFLEFAHQQSEQGFEFVLSGYAFHPQQSLSIEIDGISRTGCCPAEVIVAFARFAWHHADKLTLESDGLEAWWD